MEVGWKGATTGLWEVGQVFSPPDFSNKYIVLFLCSMCVIVHFNEENTLHYVRFEAFMAVTMKSAIFWDVTLCGSCKN
jgi:hypothetical protein